MALYLTSLNASKVRARKSTAVIGARSWLTVCKLPPPANVPIGSISISPMVPAKLRVVLGPRKGTIRKEPSGTLAAASVWPKSSLMIGVSSSTRSTNPSVRPLTRKFNVARPAFSALPCSAELIAVDGIPAHFT